MPVAPIFAAFLSLTIFSQDLMAHFKPELPFVNLIPQVPNVCDHIETLLCSKKGKEKEKRTRGKKKLVPNYALRSSSINARSIFFQPSFIHLSSRAHLNFFFREHRFSVLPRKEMHSSYAECMSNSTRACWWMCLLERDAVQQRK